MLTEHRGNSLTNDEINRIAYETTQELLEYLVTLTNQKGGVTC